MGFVSFHRLVDGYQKFEGSVRVLFCFKRFHREIDMTWHFKQDLMILLCCSYDTLLKDDCKCVMVQYMLEPFRIDFISQYLLYLVVFLVIHTSNLKHTCPAIPMFFTAFRTYFRVTRCWIFTQQCCSVDASHLEVSSFNFLDDLDFFFRVYFFFFEEECLMILTKVLRRCFEMFSSPFLGLFFLPSNIFWNNITFTIKVNVTTCQLDMCF